MSEMCCNGLEILFLCFFCLGKNLLKIVKPAELFLALCKLGTLRNTFSVCLLFASIVKNIDYPCLIILISLWTKGSVNFRSNFVLKCVPKFASQRHFSKKKSQLRSDMENLFLRNSSYGALHEHFSV